MFSAGSGHSAAKSLCRTLDTALHGSGKLFTARSKGTPDDPIARELSSPHHSPSPDATAQQTLVDPFVALAEQFPIGQHPTLIESTDVEHSFDPLLILSSSWAQCKKSLSVFTHSLKRRGGLSDPQVLEIVRHVDELVEKFQTGAVHWNVLNGVGPLHEQTLVEAIRDTLVEQHCWMDKMEAVWRSALVHLHK